MTMTTLAGDESFFLWWARNGITLYITASKVHRRLIGVLQNRAGNGVTGPLCLSPTATATASLHSSIVHPSQIAFFAVVIAISAFITAVDFIFFFHAARTPGSVAVRADYVGSSGLAHRLPSPSPRPVSPCCWFLVSRLFPPIHTYRSLLRPQRPTAPSRFPRPHRTRK